MACATPPSTWPRHCWGLTTTPASAVCTDCRMRTVPVCGRTATRNAWTLKATERGVPSWCPTALNGSGAEAAISVRPSRSAPARTPSGSSTQRDCGTASFVAAKRMIWSRNSSAARYTAKPATVVPAEPNAPVS
ncbi:Uncharacterised protein [Mycobacteroides abscessus subsp. abscessus]|nr:Uncharacterised protein [Mycobacteroides abscessus subsp. abscessus]